MFKNSFFKVRCGGLALFSILAGFIFISQPVLAAGSACGTSGEGLCQSSCGPYDDIISISTASGIGNYCSENEQCCVPSKCGYNNDGIGECENVSNCGELVGKNTSDCVPPKLCCITPKIPELICPGGVCSEEESLLEDSLSSVCDGDFKSDFCDDYISNCGLDQNSLMCQQTLIDLTNNTTISTCSGISEFSSCLKSVAACSQDQNSSECQEFIVKSNVEKGACSQDIGSSECQQFLTQNSSSESSVPLSVVACIGSSDFSSCIKLISDNITNQNPTTEWLGLIPCTGFDCTLCSVFELIKRIIDWLVEFILAISVGFIIWAGISMMFSGGDSSKLTKAKEMLTTAIYGVAITLGGWLIVGTLLGVLTGSEKIMPWNKITCTSKPLNLGTELPKLSANCISAGGTCRDITKDTDTNKCVGDYVKGLCTGSVNIQCCVPKIKLVDCSTLLKGTYTCTTSECPLNEMVSGICGFGKHCCPKNTPETSLNMTECSGVCRSSCNNNEGQASEICLDNSKICCKPNTPYCSRGTLTNIQSRGVVYCKLGNPLNTGGTPTICPKELGIAFKKADGTIDGCGEAVQNKPL